MSCVLTVTQLNPKEKDFSPSSPNRLLGICIHVCVCVPPPPLFVWLYNHHMRTNPKCSNSKDMGQHVIFFRLDANLKNRGEIATELTKLVNQCYYVNKKRMGRRKENDDQFTQDSSSGH